MNTILKGEIYYHGRTGEVKDYFDDCYLVYFSDIDDTELIDREELEHQQE